MFNPSGMKAAVDTYSSNLLEKTPPAYKLQAQAKLAGWSTNSVVSAASNKIKKDNADLVSKWDITWSNQNADIEFNLKTASDLSSENVELS